jgi:4-amino-4-deoxy-L-arabinose transferase-like glycosyltransferase
MEPESSQIAFWPVALIAFLSLFIRLAPLARSDLSFALRADDSFEYLQLAAGMRDGCGFARLVGGSCHKPEILRTPGYPAFLSVMSSMRWALAAQATLGALTCAIIGTWLWRYGHFAAAIAAELLIAFDIPSIVMSTEVMSEILFQFLLVSALIPLFFVHLRTRRPLVSAILTGLAGGFAILVRPIGLLLPILLPVPFIITPEISRRLRLASAIAVFVISALIPGAWAMRNYQVARYPGLSTVSAINMYFYRAANVVAREKGALLADTRDSFGTTLGVPYEHIYDADVQSPELCGRMNHLAIQILKAHWRQAMMMTLQSALYLAVAPMRSPLARMLDTTGDSAGDGLNAGAPSVRRLRDVLRRTFQSPILTLVVSFEVVFTLVLWIGVAAAAYRSRNLPGEYRFLTLYLTLIAIILLALAAGGEADARFRAPVAPLVAIVAALGYFPGKSPQFEQDELEEGSLPAASRMVGR